MPQQPAADDSGPRWPILTAHDHTKPIGMVKMDGTNLVCEFTEDFEVTTDLLFEIFGGAGILLSEAVHRANGSRLVRKGSILQFPLCPPGASAGQRPGQLPTAIDAPPATTAPIDWTLCRRAELVTWPS